MKLLSISTILFVLISLPLSVNAASISNNDNEVHQIKGRVAGKTGDEWAYVTVGPNGTKYFNCRFGCELVLEKSGSSVNLESDADIVIRNGVLKVK